MDVWNVGEVRSMWIVSVDECCKLYYGDDVDLIGENECDKWLKELRWVEWICIVRYWFGGCDWVGFESNDWMNE